MDLNQAGLHQKKQPPTVDEVIERKFNSILDVIDNHTEKIYNDFNQAMQNGMNQIIKTENDLTKMVNLLWGLLNKSNVRMAGLESVLVKNGLSLQEVEKEVLTIENKMKETGQWVDIPIEDAVKGSIPTPRRKES